MIRALFLCAALGSSVSVCSVVMKYKYGDAHVDWCLIEFDI